MGFPEETAQAIRGLDEHWDGKGHPDGLQREGIPLLARICGLAQTAEVFLTDRGPAAAEEVVRLRSGGWFDPALVEALLAEVREDGLWEDPSREDPWREVSLLEPDDRALKATPSAWTSWPAPSPRSSKPSSSSQTATPRGSRGWPWRWPNAPAWARKVSGT